MNGTNGNEPGYPENALVPYPVIVAATNSVQPSSGVWWIFRRVAIISSTYCFSVYAVMNLSPDIVWKLLVIWCTAAAGVQCALRPVSLPS